LPAYPICRFIFALVSASGKTQVATTVVAPKWHNSGGSKKPAYLLAKAVVFLFT